LDVLVVLQDLEVLVSEVRILDLLADTLVLLLPRLQIIQLLSLFIEAIHVFGIDQSRLIVEYLCHLRIGNLLSCERCQTAEHICLILLKLAINLDLTHFFFKGFMLGSGGKDFVIHFFKASLSGISLMLESQIFVNANAPLPDVRREIVCNHELGHCFVKFRVNMQGLSLLEPGDLSI
jgi:hypothetical protein